MVHLHPEVRGATASVGGIVAFIADGVSLRCAAVGAEARLGLASSVIRPGNCHLATSYRLNVSGQAIYTGNPEYGLKPWILERS